jgi:hypothetical protein
VTAAVPDWPSLLAVMVTLPAAMPVTSPVAETVAIALSLLDQPTMRPDKGFPLASTSVAVSATVWFTVIVAVAGVTVTAATGTWRTSTTADPCFPSTVATITAFPGARPVTRPDAETLASDGVPLDQKIVRPVSGCPDTLRGVATSWTEDPTTILGDAGVTSTAATGSGAIVTSAVPDAASLVAVIVAVPVEIPVTRPLADTVATWVLLDENEMDCPVST